MVLTQLERFLLDCRKGLVLVLVFYFTTPFGWLVYFLWFWFYDSQVKTALLASSVNIAFTIPANLITLNSIVADDTRLK